MTKKYDDEDGVWRTIGGRRIFIKNGQDLASAMKESGKFKSASKGTAKKEITEEEKEKAKEVEKGTKIDPYDDPESEESQRLQYIQSRYDEYLQATEGRGASYGELAHIESLRGKELDDFEKELDDFEESDLDKVKRIQGNLDKKGDKLTKEEGLKLYKEKFEQYEKTTYNEKGQNIDGDKKLAQELKKIEKDYDLKGKDTIPIETEIAQKHDKIIADIQDKNRNDREALRNAEKEYGELSKKMQADDYYYKPEDDRKLKEFRAKADIERVRQGIDTQEKYDKLMSEDSKKMTAPLGKEDDIGKTPYEKGEKYRNSIIETAKNSKEDNVTLDTETGKVATFDKGYSVSFQQSSDNYDDKEYYEKVEECRNKCDGKLYAGKYGGDAEASFHTDDIETAKELMYKYNQESIYDWEHETLIMNDKYDSSSNKTNYEAEKSTNDIMNEKIRSRGKTEDDLPKHVEIKSQGTSNRKEVSENIQAHILEYYDSPEDFVEQMNYMHEPTMWRAGQKIAEGGSYLIYNGDMADFLDELKINPKGKTFSEDKAFDMYTSLIGRESAKLYDRIQKNSYKKYMKAHPLSKMSFEEFKNMRGGK